MVALPSRRGRSPEPPGMELPARDWEFSGDWEFRWGLGIQVSAPLLSPRGHSLDQLPHGQGKLAQGWPGPAGFYTFRLFPGSLQLNPQPEPPSWVVLTDSSHTISKPGL